MLDVSLLGTGGMMPMPKRFLSSMIMRLNGRLIVVDCGEGTQVSLKNLGWGFKAIDAIMFTHFHADHISGLPGMLLAIGNAGRTEPLKLVGPKGLAFVVDGLRRIAQDIPFEIEYIEVDEKNQQEIEVSGFTASTLFVEHSVKCIAYKFEVRRKGRFDAKKALELGLPKKEWSVLQKGTSVEYNGINYTADMVLGDFRQGITICFCTDSRPVEELIDFIKESDLFICEGMYGENEKLNKAIENKHMLFSEAARLAKDGNVKKMWLTHYSPALSEPEEFLENARNIFENTVLGFDGITETIMFEK
ncbi:MAG: ribonuclease Z [Parabacteroides sp.]|nr:ribonuclease Z [Parabacteroides sp.]